MKKSTKICLSLIVVLSLMLSVAAIYYNKSTSNLKKGYLVYSHHNTGMLCVYDIENSVEKIYPIKGFSNIESVGNYYGGNFCCIGKNSQSGNDEILFFKDSSLEKTIPIPCKALASVAHDQDVYFSTESNLYSIDKSTGEIILIDSISSIPFINSRGVIAYLRNDTNLSSEADYSKNTLCILDNGKIYELGIVDKFLCWLSEDRILATVTNVVINKNDRSQTTQYKSEKVIINVSTGNKEKTNMFDKVVLQANLSEDNTKAVCWYPIDGSTDLMRLGIYDINNDKTYKYAIGTSSLNNISSFFLWLDENPIKNFSSVNSEENIGINNN